MTREMKFRGKDILTDKWVYGDLLHLGNAYAIVTSYEEEELKVNPISDRLEIRVEDIAGVLPETVGQLTGQLDKNKKEIWEGDIVRVGILSPNYTGSYPEPYYVDTVCIYKEGAFLYKRISPFDKKKLSRNWTYKPMHRYEIYSTEVIGNIHDTPELLKTETL